MSAWVLVARSKHRIVDAGFWLEPVTYEAPALAGATTEQDLETIESIALSEIVRAFAGLRITFSDRRDATYRVHVVQELRDLRFQREVHVAGESRAITGLGGLGAVSFRFLAVSAISYAPPHADRATIVAAIGTGIGRAAVHEFAHQLLPTAPIHDSTDARSYEYASAARPEQYYGAMHWDLAWPMLQKRIGQYPQEESQRLPLTRKPAIADGLP